LKKTKSGETQCQGLINQRVIYPVEIGPLKIMAVRIIYGTPRVVGRRNMGDIELLSHTLINP